jgi:hypothetical protein
MFMPKKFINEIKASAVYRRKQSGPEAHFLGFCPNRSGGIWPTKQDVNLGAAQQAAQQNTQGRCKNLRPWFCIVLNSGRIQIDFNIQELPC